MGWASKAGELTWTEWNATMIDKSGTTVGMGWTDGADVRKW